MNIKVLATGSSGNAYIVDDGCTKLLLECGLPYRKLMAASGFTLHEVDACLMTHEHNDHAWAIKDVMEHGIRVYCSEGTAIAKKVAEYHLSGQQRSLHHMSPVQIGSIMVLPFDTDHDAAEPLGFMIYSRMTKERLLFATDTATLDYDFPGLTHIMIECNNLGIGSMGDANASLADRILTSHLSLEECLCFLHRQDLSNVQVIYLIHMSDMNGDPKVMHDAVAAATGKHVIVAGYEGRY